MPYVYVAAVPYTVLESTEIEEGHTHSLIVTQEYGALTLCEDNGDTTVVLDSGETMVWEYQIIVTPRVATREGQPRKDDIPSPVYEFTIIPDDIPDDNPLEMRDE